MVIKASSGKEVESLLLDLKAGDDATRDGAVARLTLIGPRAVPRLVALARDERANGDARAAALRALDAIGDSRSLPVALDLAADPDASVAVAAVGVARGFLRGAQAVSSLDRLTGIALDRGQPSIVRIAALHALSDLDPATIQPVRTALEGDTDAAVAALVARDVKPAAPAPPGGRSLLARAAAGALPDDPSQLRTGLARAGTALPLTALHQIVEQIRRREQDDPGRRAEWMAARAAAHLVLAQRASRVALYDLRETLDAATAPLAVEFLAALTLIGDASCLESIASAYARERAASTDGWWRRHLEDAFQAIVERHQLTKRHAVMRKIEKRSPDTFRSLYETQLTKGRAR